MKSKYPFEEFVKSTLEHYEPEVPAHIWNRIDQQTDRRPAFWLFFKKYSWLFLILMIGGGAGSYLFFSGTHTMSTGNLSLHHTTANERKLQATINNNSSATAPSISNSPSDEHIITTNELKNDRPALTSSFSSSSEKRISNSTSKALTSIYETTADPVVNHLKFKKSGSRKRVNTLASRISELAEAPATPAVEEKIASADLKALNENTAFKNLLRRKELQTNVFAKPRKDLSIPCPGSGNEAWGKSYIDLYAGPDFVYRQLTDTLQSAYLEQRKQSTSFYYAYSAGIRYTKVFNNGLSFRVGLNYSEVTEKFDFIQGNIIQIIYVTDAAGDTIGSYQSVSSRHKVTFNKYRTLDIPVVAGYEWTAGKWNFNFNGGVVVNVYSWNRGVVLDRTLQPVVISNNAKSNPYQFKTNIGLGAMASGSFSYGLNEKLKVFAEPYIRFNLSSMSKSEQSLKQRFHTAGLRFGVRMDLKK